ncbi:hypothetical protein WMY93_021741 [Mugilogobius chulae]|uniref:Uncharacterized protein n=1 Tax=Mugilogobius chulae TaxID=88201 RepID=A0AAW0NHA5_9GOBI
MSCKKTGNTTAIQIRSNPQLQAYLAYANPGFQGCTTMQIRAILFSVVRLCHTNGTSLSTDCKNAEEEEEELQQQTVGLTWDLLHPGNISKTHTRRTTERTTTKATRKRQLRVQI